MSENGSGMGMITRTSEGLSERVRSARMPLSVAVIAIVAPIALSAIIFVFAPIPDIA